MAKISLSAIRKGREPNFDERFKEIMEGLQEVQKQVGCEYYTSAKLLLTQIVRRLEYLLVNLTPF